MLDLLTQRMKCPLVFADAETVSYCTLSRLSSTYTLGVMNVLLTV